MVQYRQGSSVPKRYDKPWGQIGWSMLEMRFSLNSLFGSVISGSFKELYRLLKVNTSNYCLGTFHFRNLHVE